MTRDKNKTCVCQDSIIVYGSDDVYCAACGRNRPAPSFDVMVEVGGAKRKGTNTGIDFERISTEKLIDALPENISYYKDSGSWGVFDEEEECLCRQWVDESFREFLIRFARQCVELEEGDDLGDYETLINLSIAHH